MLDIISSIDWTPIVTGIVTIFLTFISRLIVKFAVPWLKQHNLTIAADIAVKAAEAIYGRYNGDVKLKAVLENLKQQGFDVNSKDVVYAVQAAWEQLNLDMIAAKLKGNDEHNENIETSEDA